MVLSNDIESDISCKVLDFNSPEQLESIELRRHVLRIPLGLDFDENDLIKESDEIHIAAYHKSDLVGTLLFKLLESDSGKILKMRQVAVKDTFQGRGIGRIMVKFSEQWAVNNQYYKIELNARKTAVPFYLSLEYLQEGNEFLEVGIPHYKMYKILSQNI